MDNNYPSFLKMEGDSVLYNGTGEFFFYVPESFFSSNAAYVQGEVVSVLGILDYSINNKPDTYGNNLKCFNWPTIFFTRPYEITKVKDLSLNGRKGKEYRILKYRKGDVIIININTPKSIVNVEIFYNLFCTTANIPVTKEYGTIWKYFIDCMSLNAGSYNITHQAFGLLESELCRDANDLSKPFRLSSKVSDPLAYISVGIKDIPKYVNAYTALTSENWDESVIAACMNKSKVHTPLEKVLMG